MVVPGDLAGQGRRAAEAPKSSFPSESSSSLLEESMGLQRCIAVDSISSSSAVSVMN